MESFGALDAGSERCRFIWNDLCEHKFSDSCLDNIKEGDLVALRKHLEKLQTLRNMLQVLNEQAIQDITQNLRTVVDGGSDDLKTAMRTY